MEERRNAENCAATAQQREDILLKGVSDLNDLQIFSNPEFGSIRSVDQNGGFQRLLQHGGFQRRFQHGGSHWGLLQSKSRRQK